MCIVAYIGSDVPLPLCAWTQEARAFNVADLDKSEQAARQQFDRRYVYCVGSSLNCGCQFATGAQGEDDCEPSDDLEEGKRDRHNLVLFLRAALRRQQSVELLTCWNGDWSDSPDRTLTVTPEYFEQPDAFPYSSEGGYAYTVKL
jgi:hypothetical protein